MYYYDAAHVLDAWEGSGLLCQDNAATNSLVALEQYADRALSQDHFLLKRKITSPHSLSNSRSSKCHIFMNDIQVLKKRQN